jgi:low affinity Fe/Cu permease
MGRFDPYERWRMNTEADRRISRWLERFALRVTYWTGSSWAFAIASVMVVAWLVTGQMFHYSDTWQLVMNTISSVVTFLMVFLIQRSQNKDTMAMQIKLDELIASKGGADNRLISVEALSEEQVRALHERYQELAERVMREGRERACIRTAESALKAVESESLSPDHVAGGLKL